MTLDEQIEVIKAAKDGKKVTYFHLDRSISIKENHMFNFNGFDYTIEEPPAKILWTHKTCPSGLEFRNRKWDSDSYATVSSVDARGISFVRYEKHHHVEWGLLADYYTQRNGDQCHD